MKSIYFWIVAAIFSLGILPAAADNIQFTLNVPNPEAVKCSVNYQPYEIHKGANEMDIDQWSTVELEWISPWIIKRVTDKNGTSAGYIMNGKWTLYCNPEDNGQVFNVEIVNLDEFRTATFTVNVDDPALVDAVLYGYNTTLKLEKGSNTIKFDPAAEQMLAVSAVNYKVPLYSVTKNGTPVEKQGQTFIVDELEDGDVVDITAILPDIDRTVTFSYGENSIGSIGVRVNDVPVEDFNNELLVVKLGSIVTVFTKSGYAVDKAQQDGEDIYFTGSYEFTVMEDTEIYIEAHELAKFKATVIVPNPDWLTLYRGYEYDNDVVALQEGENEIELTENPYGTYVSWKISQDAICNEVTLNGTALYSYMTSTEIKEGDVLMFDMTEKVYDLSLRHVSERMRPY